MVSTLKQKARVWGCIMVLLNDCRPQKNRHTIFAGRGFFFVLGGLEAMMIRIQLDIPENDIMSAGFYNEVMTMHGKRMIFLAAMPLLFALMNAVLTACRLVRGTSRFHSVNSLGFWLFFFGGIF